MEHSITGEKSWHLDSYDLSKTDTQESKRNFPGLEKKQYYNLADIQKGDHHAGFGGMTETDSDTSGKDDGPYTSIQEKGQKSRWPTKSSANGKEK
jgi:hypothetical protein